MTWRLQNPSQGRTSQLISDASASPGREHPVKSEQETDKRRTSNVQLARGEQVRLMRICLRQIEHRVMYSSCRELLCRTVCFKKDFATCRVVAGGEA